MLVQAGSTNVTTYFHLRLATDGTDATGLTITGIDLQYTRSGAAPTAKVDATALAAADSAHGDNQAFEIDGTDQPGVYRVDWPDAAFAAGVREVILTVKVATAFTESLRVQITGFDPADGVRAGLTALPNAGADEAGGLPISDAGGLDLDAQIGTKINDILTDTGTTLQGELDGIQTDTEDIQSRLPAALVNGRMDSSIDDTGLEAGAAGVIADAVWDEDATGHQTGGTFGQAIGDPGANTETIYDAVVTDAAGTNVAADIIAVKAETAAIVADTNELQTDDTPGALAAIDAKIDTAQADLDILTGTDGATLATSQPNYAPAVAGDEMALEVATVAEIADAVWNEVISGHISAGTAGNYLHNLFFGQISALGAVTDAGASATEFDTNLAGVDDIWNDQTLVFVSGNLIGHARPIADFADADGHVTFDEALVAAPDNGSLFLVLSDHVHPITQVQNGLATQTSVDAISDTIGAAGAGLTEAGGTGDQLTAITAKTALIPGTQDGKTFAEHVLLQSAVLLGIGSGLETEEATYRSLDDTVDRVVATVDEDGNRTAVAYDTSSP